MKKEAESGSEADDSDLPVDEDSMSVREQALLVRFYISCRKLLIIYR